jgi:methyl-accepting chemotaxis protein
VKNSSQPDAGARLAAKLVGFMVDIGDASNIILDPELDSGYLMDAVVIRLPELHHEIEINRNLMRKRVAGGSNAVSTLDVKVSLDRIRLKLGATKRSLDTAFSNNLDIQSALSGMLRTLDSEVSAYLNLVESELKKQSINIQLISGQADTSQSTWQSLASATAPELKTLLEKRISGLTTEMYSNLVIVLVSIVLSIIAAFYLYRSVTVPLSQAIDVFQRIQRGDLSSKISVDSTCETGMLLQALNEMQTHLGAIDDVSHMLNAMGSGDLKVRINTQYQGKFNELKDNANRLAETFVDVVGNIQETASAVRVAAGEISEGNKNLSNRTESQAASLEQTAASMEEITSTIKQNTENARQADQLSAVARETAEEGGKVVSRAIQAMSTINESSSKIADIISVIDEIAFQTNLLALNASVEAARAGEQGRGFAVVAGEVRNLAGRSATAAKEIKELIEDSVGKVEEGSALVNHSGETLKEIVESVTKVSNIVSEITAASEEQTLGIEEMNRAITQIDEVTQQNTALVEEVAAASEATGDEAADLERQMMFFDIGNGGGARAKPAAPGSNRRSPDRAFSQPAAAQSSKLTPLKAAAGDEFWEEF